MVRGVSKRTIVKELETPYVVYNELPRINLTGIKLGIYHDTPVHLEPLEFIKRAIDRLGIEWNRPRDHT